MNLKTFDTPIASITDLKKSPMDIFKEAEDQNNPVYILNRNKDIGVVMTTEQYETIVQSIELLKDELLDYEVEKRINNPNPEAISYEDFQKKYNIKPEKYNALNDDWE